MKGVYVCATPTHPLRHTQHALPSNEISSSLLTCTWTTAAPRSDIDPRGLAGFLVVTRYIGQTGIDHRAGARTEKGEVGGEEEEEEVEM